MTPEEKKLRENSLDWFLSLNHVKKLNLKERYFPDAYIKFDSHWGYHYTFGQIAEMYIKLNWEIYEWMEDGNVMHLATNVYTTQDAQWQNRIAGYANLRNYFVKEFII